jgi:hypothetical protein
MLNNGAYPDYEEKDMQKIVETLFIKGYKVHADKICNMYGEKNIHLLRDLYRRYNEFS